MATQPPGQLDGLEPIYFVKDGLHMKGQVNLGGTYMYVEPEVAAVDDDEQIATYGAVYYRRGIRPGMPPAESTYLSPSARERIEADIEATSNRRSRREDAKPIQQAPTHLTHVPAPQDTPQSAQVLAARERAAAAGELRSAAEGGFAPHDDDTAPSPAPPVAGWAEDKMPHSSGEVADISGHEAGQIKGASDEDPHHRSAAQGGLVPHDDVVTRQSAVPDDGGASGSPGGEPRTPDPQPARPINDGIIRDSDGDPVPPWDDAPDLNVPATKERLSTSDEATVRQFVVWEKNRAKPRSTLLDSLPNFV